MYTGDQLRDLRSPVYQLDDVTRQLVVAAGLAGPRYRPRGCRAGKKKYTAAGRRPLPCLRAVGNGACVITGNRPPVRPVRSDNINNHRPSLVSVSVLRHTETVGRALTFGSMNVRSLSLSKLDDLLDVAHDCRLDVLLLCETWHDSDTVSIRRLRASGYAVVERARPRPRHAEASLGVNHGGVAIVAAPGVRLTSVNIGVLPSTFEYVVARITSGPSSCVVAVLYRTGPITASFFAELTDVLERLSTFNDPLFLAGDVNIRLERTSDPHTVEFTDLLAAYGLVQRVREVTHDAGGTLDIVCTRDDLREPKVEVIDVGLSDHRLLRWTSQLQRPPPVYTSSTRRLWRSFDADAFHGDLLTSALCDESTYAALDGDALALLFDNTITELLDHQVPVCHVTCRRRQSCVWFDDECRTAKRAVRSLERAVRRAKSQSIVDPSIVAAWRDQRRQYTELRRRKCSAFWSSRVDAEQSQPRRLWRSFDELLGRHAAPPSSDIDATTLHRFFDDKVAAVRAATAGADPPSFTPAPVGCVLRMFSPVKTEDIVSLIRALPDKQCTFDPLPTWLLKRNSETLAPFLCQLFNRSLEHGVVPSTFKSAYITPLLKKADLDPADAKSYRPISNLSVISKLLERLVCQQLVKYLKTNGLLPDLQSAYRAHHSTETAVLKVLSDILLALDTGNLAMLTLLDLSAAFDSVDHQTLLQRLQTSYGLGGNVLNWFESYLRGRTQHVRFSATSSTPSAVDYGVPQGSVLGPILFLLYTADLLQLIKRHSLTPHAYADDTQIYGFCGPNEVNRLADGVSDCIDETSAWLMANRLQLNPIKTEVLWCAPSRRQYQIPTGPVRVGNTTVMPVSQVRDLGVYLDADVTMRAHVTATVRMCFAALRQIRSVRHYLPRHALLTLIRALVVSKVDYCNSVLAGVSAHLLDRLQSVLNAAARLVFSARKTERISPLLQELHWLRVPERIKFRLCVLVYRCLHGTAPSYLAESLHLSTGIAARRRLRSAASPTLLVSTTRRSTLGDRAFPVAASRAWNSLPADVRAAPSLLCFRRRLKTLLFRSHRQ